MHVDIVSTEGEVDVLKNLKRKAKQADEMFSQLVGFMNDALHIESAQSYNEKETLPSWL